MVELDSGVGLGSGEDRCIRLAGARKEDHGSHLCRPACPLFRRVEDHHRVAAAAAAADIEVVAGRIRTGAAVGVEDHQAEAEEVGSCTGR